MTLTVANTTTAVRATPEQAVNTKLISRAAQVRFTAPVTKMTITAAEYDFVLNLLASPQVERPKLRLLLAPPPSDD